VWVLDPCGSKPAEDPACLPFWWFCCMCGWRLWEHRCRQLACCVGMVRVSTHTWRMWPDGTREGAWLEAEGLVVKAGSLALMVLRAASMEPSSSAPPSCRSCRVCSTQAPAADHVCGVDPALWGAPSCQHLPSLPCTHLLCCPVPDPDPIGDVCIAYPGLHRVELQQLDLQAGNTASAHCARKETRCWA
jgi:hypothetical protein